MGMMKNSTAISTFVVVSFTLLANFFSYLFQLLMGRMLSPADYGLLFSLASLWNIISLLGTSFSTIVARYAAGFAATGKNEKIGAMMKQGFRDSLLLGAAIFIALILLSSMIGNFLQTGDQTLLLALFASSFTLFLLPLFLGVLQGTERFFGFGFTSALVPFSKLAIAILLVYLGFGVLGGIAGLLVSGFIGTLAGFWFLKDIKRSGDFSFSGSHSYSVIVLLSVIFSGILWNADAVLARHFLSPEDSGIYSMIAVLGKIILYAPAGIGIVLFPRVAGAHERGEATKGKLIKALVAVIVISGAITAAYFIFPSQIVSLLFGESYLLAANHIALYGIAMFFLSVNGVLCSYELSKGRGGFIAVLALTLVIQIAAIAFFHSSVQEIVISVLISNIVGLFLFAIIYLWRLYGLLRRR